LGSAPQLSQQLPRSKLPRRPLRGPTGQRGRNRDLDEILKAAAAAGPSKLQRAIERILRLNPQLNERQIHKRTAELKLTNWYRPWSAEEKDYVLEYARELSVVEMARNLRRTPEAVSQMLWRNGESVRVKDGYTRQDLAQIFHVSPKKVRGWISLGWLTPCGGRIKDRGLNRFLKEHRDQIDLGRIDREFRLWFLDASLQDDGAGSCEGASARQLGLNERVCS
jgi:hypothetical protein